MTVCDLPKSRGGRQVAAQDIIGNIEVRTLAGRELEQRKPITRATLIRWRDLHDFPEPFRVLKGTPHTELWDRREVVAWLRARGQQ